MLYRTRKDTRKLNSRRAARHVVIMRKLAFLHTYAVE